MAASAAFAAPEQGQLDASRSLFSVLSAINAAGYDADLNSTNNHPLRAEVRAAIAARKPQSLAAIRNFFEQHKQRNSSAELAQYISFALATTGPPDFAWKARGVEVPPDAMALEGLAALLPVFEHEAGLDELWTRSQPAFEEVIARYHEPVTNAVLQAGSYLRTPTGQFLGRRFQIYIDLLGAPNQIQTRSYGNEYFVVVTPSLEPQVSDIRHAYLHYLLDPLSTKYSEDVLKKRGLSDFAQGAPALDESYKSDFLLLVTESLIKAVEARLDRKPAAEVEQAVREGFVLASFFREQLPAYEKQEQAMRLYFPDLVGAIDVKREEARLAKVQFASSARVRHARTAPPPKPPEITGARKTMEEAEQLYEARDLDKAKDGYLRVLRETGEKPLHAKSYYGLARIAILQKDPETAEKLFEKALESSPEPPVKAWTLIYLARLADVAGDRERATRAYREALAVEGASAAARKAAEQGIQRSFAK